MRRWGYRNLKMKKELQALEKLRQNKIDNSHLFDDELLYIIEKALKALEIIKKRCNINFNEEDLRVCFMQSQDIIVITNNDEREYKLLKEVLK